ncbi:cytochrome P450 [Obba rivulosa]|uniref:Cytochrome P450 n=1 Tax=Obba rivulosa TaxID=1052685 RepID=A0A8E2DH33_9APHY|nr:cytochrome P450 [Obba rivulosa]
MSYTSATLLDVQLALALLLAAAYAFRRYRRYKASKGLPFPPGPPGNLLTGNILEVSQYEAPSAFTRYQRQYGDVMMFRGLGSRVLVLNSLQAINDLLDKRASNYSHRPISISGGELIGFGESMLLLPYGAEWRAHRKLAHVALNPTQVKEYQVLQEDIAAWLAKGLLETPEDFVDVVRISAGRLIIAVTYGIPASPTQTEASSERFAEAAKKAVIPGYYLCDFLPFLKHAPSWVPFQRELQEGRQIWYEFLTRPFEHVKSEMATGGVLPSLMRNLLSSPPKDVPDFERRLMLVGGVMFGAGSETIYATILALIMAMALNPDKQRLAQAEIDAVIGDDRLPTVEDRPNLPYVNAVIKETMRWQPVNPLGVGRRSAEDDFYNGYYIPKDTIVVPNTWCVSTVAYAPNAKYDPNTFIPERFLDNTQTIVDPTAYAFGYGRRACPGRYMGENSVFIFAATILASFRISRLDGEELVQRFSQHLVRYAVAEPYKCSIVSRSAAKAKLIELRAADSKA